MDIKTALATATKLLIQNKIKNPHLDAEILLSHTLKKSREYLLTYPEKKLTKNQVSSFNFQISRRAKGEPIAYITGHKQFHGLNFYVDKNVLIPRPETELMIDETLKLVTHNTKHITFIDVGTGSGCIIITLATLLKKTTNTQRSIYNIQYLATDISKPALSIARKNAKLHNVYKQIKFLHGNLLKPILQKSQYLTPNTQYLILANLPYLTSTQIKNSPSIQYEPKIALSAGPDGLKYYQQLFKQIKRLYKSVPNLCISVLCEIDHCQISKIKQLAKHELLACRSFNKGRSQFKLQTKKDLAGLNRLTIIQIQMP